MSSNHELDMTTDIKDSIMTPSKEIISRSKLNHKYLKHDDQLCNLDNLKEDVTNSDEFIEREIKLEEDKVKEMELMHITDYNRLFEMNKELFKTMRDDPYSKFIDSDIEDSK